MASAAPACGVLSKPDRNIRVYGSSSPLKTGPEILAAARLPDPRPRPPPGFAIRRSVDYAGSMPSDRDERVPPDMVRPDIALSVTEPAPKKSAPKRHPSDPRFANERVQAALAASTRTEATLSGLVRAVQEVTSGLNGARDANEQLARELGRVREALAASVDEKTALEVQLSSLVVERDHALREVERAREDAERERSFLIEEQDRFLTAVLDEHEQALARLRAERDELSARLSSEQRGREKTTAPGLKRARRGELPTNVDTLQQELSEARLALDKLWAERTRALETLRRLQAQRDEAQQALADGRWQASESRTAPGLDPATVIHPGAQTQADASELQDAPDVAGPPGSGQPPPAAKQAGGPSAAPPQPEPVSTALPFGAYSLGSEDVETEHVEGAHLSALKPPRH